MKKHAEHDAEQKPVENPAPEAATTRTADESPAAEGATDSAPKAGGESAKAEVSSGLEAKNAELEKKNAELQDQYLRKAADFDNYRKRMIREKQEAIDFANANLLVELVQILDDFDRAIGSAVSQEPGTPGAAFADGITMIRKQLGSMLENKYGLVYYPTKDTPFDPNLHEAIGKVPSEDVKEPMVAEEFVKGYKLKDRVIRHAKVMVKMPVEK